MSKCPFCDADLSAADIEAQTCPSCKKELAAVTSDHSPAADELDDAMDLGDFFADEAESESDSDSNVSVEEGSSVLELFDEVNGEYEAGSSPGDVTVPDRAAAQTVETGEADDPEVDHDHDTADGVLETVGPEEIPPPPEKGRRTVADVGAATIDVDSFSDQPAPTIDQDSANQLPPGLAETLDSTEIFFGS